MHYIPGSESDEYWFEEGCYITEWCNDAAVSPELSIARARVPADERTRWHALAGITERYVILEGRGTAELGDAAEPVALRPGDVLVIAPGERQRVTSCGPGDLVFLAICTPRFHQAAYRELEGRGSPPD